MGGCGAQSVFRWNQPAKEAALALSAQSEHKAGLRMGGVQVEFSIMLGRDSEGHAKTESPVIPMLTAGVKRIKDFDLPIVRNPRAIIGDGNFTERYGLAIVDADSFFVLVGNCIHRIID
jgi:hypothetical protein